MQNSELTLLSKEQIWGANAVEVLKKYGTIAAISDVAILTGAFCDDTQTYMAPDDDSLKGRTGFFIRAPKMTLMFVQLV